MCLLPLRISLCVFMVGCMIQFLPYGWIQYTDFHWVHQVYCWVCSSICGHCGHFYILAFVDEKHESVDISYVPIRISLDIYQVGDTMTILRPFPGRPIPQIIFCFFLTGCPSTTHLLRHIHLFSGTYSFLSVTLLSLRILEKPWDPQTYASNSLEIFIIKIYHSATCTHWLNEHF